MLKINHFIIIISILFANSIFAKEIKNFEMPSGEELEVRVFNADGDSLILGLPCDFGKSKNEELTAKDLASDGYEVWMPDFLSSQMIAKTSNNYKNIPSEDLIYLLQQAQQTGKNIYILASGTDAKIALTAIAKWEERYKESNIKGALLLFPRFLDGKPTPGIEPKYVDVVGKTKAPLMIIEGGKTPNKWGLKHLTQKLSAGGSKVDYKIVPGVRGYFFNRDEPNRGERIVTSQLGGLIKVGVFYLEQQ